MAFGGDGGRALLIAALASLLVSTRWRATRVALGAFVLDRAWPLWALGAEFGGDAVLASVMWSLQTLPGDAIWLGLRAIAIYAVVAALWRLRLALHGRAPEIRTPKTAKA